MFRSKVDVLLINQVVQTPSKTFDTCVALVKDRFGGDVSIYNIEDGAAGKAGFPNVDLVRGSAIVYLMNSNEQPVLAKEAKKARHGAFRIDLDASDIRLRLRRLDRTPDYEKADAHVFNRLSATKEKGYMYFPYGYTYRMAGHGPLDEFGFRINVDLDKIKNRESNQKLICTFGGSTTWSIDCLPSETFTAQMEDRLNSLAIENNSPTRFVCLNFGQVAYTVLSELNAFILFAWQLQPDIVVAHDGWNDLLYGCYGDQYLLQERSIAYPCDLEPWAEYLHGGAGVQTTKNGPKPYPFRSPPSAIIRAYFERKLQFKAICEAAGAKFIWGLQPCANDKQNLSDIERKLTSTDNPANQDDWKYVRARVPELMRQVGEGAKGSIDNFVDVGAAFADLDPNTQHFSDNVHLLPAGDREVALTYCKHIASSFYPELK